MATAPSTPVATTGWGESLRASRDANHKLGWPLDVYKSGMEHVRSRDVKLKDRMFDPITQVGACAAHMTICVRVCGRMHIRIRHACCCCTRGDRAVDMCAVLAALDGVAHCSPVR